MWKWSIWLVSTALLLGCTTPYQHRSRTGGLGGYSDQYLGDDVYLITIRLNAFTDKATAYEYFHRRARDIVRVKGYERYEVIEYTDPDEHSVSWIGDKPTVWRSPRLQGRIKCYSEAAVATVPDEQRPTGGTGTAWPIAAGLVVTNEHVVAAHPYIYLKQGDYQITSAVVVRRDSHNDLVLLRVADSEWLPPAIPIAATPASIGEEVFTIGFPAPDLMGFSPKLTSGTVASVFGIQDDPRAYQVSVPVQPGNSGGPLLNLRGEAIGVVTSTLSAEAALSITGSLPQTVNYAIKSVYLTAMLKAAEAEGIVPTLSRAEGDLADVGARIQPSVMLVIASDTPLADAPPPMAFEEEAPDAADTSLEVKTTHATAGVDTISYTVQTLREGLWPITTYSRDKLEGDRLAGIARILGVSAGSVKTFRWANSMAPKGHLRAGLISYRVTTEAHGISRSVTLWVDGDGNVIERSVQ